VAPREPPAGGAEPERFEGPDAFTELPLDPSLSRLPPGRHGLPRSFVDHHQRQRIVAAMLRLLSLCGYPGITIGHLTREAGVSRTAFYAQFEGKEACLLATHDLVGRWLCERVARAAAASEAWPDRVSAGTSEALRLLAANPELAHLLAIEILKAGPAARERQQALLVRFAAALRAGHRRGAERSADLEELLLGGALSLIAHYVDAECVDRLPDAAHELAEYLLIPYRRERPAGSPPRPPEGRYTL
jgi:AcrR family transcriptional regulator